MLFSISTHPSTQIQGQLMSMTEVVSGVVKLNDKSKPNPFAGLKIRISKCVVSFYFPSVIKRRKFTLVKSYQHQIMDAKCPGIKNQLAEVIKETSKANDLM